MSNCGGPIYRKRQVLGKLETDCAEPVVLGKEDGGVEIAVAPEANPDIQMHERDVARISLTKLQSIPGEIKGSVSFSSEFKGSGELTTPPPVDAYLQGCGLERATVYRMEVEGNLAELDLPVGTLLTDDDDEDVRFITVLEHKKEDNDGFVYFEKLGTADPDGGEDSTAEFYLTIPGQELPVLWEPEGDITMIACGFSYTPISTGMKTLTIRVEEDNGAEGYKKEIYGAMGTFKLNVESSGLGVFEFDFSGVISKGFVKYGTVPPSLGGYRQGTRFVGTTSGARAFLVRAIPADGVLKEELHYIYETEERFSNGETLNLLDGTVIGVMSGAPNDPTENPEYRAGFGDFPMTAGVVFADTVPPILQNAKLKFEADDIAYVPIFASVGLDSGNTVSVRKDANSPNGLKEAMIGDRRPTISIDPEFMSEADFDIYNRWFNGEPVSLSFRLGKGGDGNTLIVSAKKAQFTGLSGGDRDGLTAVSIEAMLAGDVDDNDDEYKLIFI